MPAKGKQYYYINTIAKAIKILELLAEKEKLSVSDIAKYFGFDRTGSHRYLATLKELGYVEQEKDHKYQLTSKLLALGSKYSQRFEIIRSARPFLEKLNDKFNETINLGRFIGNEILQLDRIDSTEILRIDSPLGTRVPAYCTALGKAILSTLKPDELTSYLKKIKLERYGPNTILSLKKLKIELKETSKRGYAIDNEEFVNGLTCIAAPVFTNSYRAHYAIGLSVPTARFYEVDSKNGHLLIMSMCKELSEKLGDAIKI